VGRATRRTRSVSTKLAEKAVADLGMTRQELFEKLGLPDSDSRTA
jgi:hypothetical protein